MIQGLKFGVLCSGTVFQKWQADALHYLEEDGHELKLMIIDERALPQNSEENEKPGIRYSLMWRVCSRFLFQHSQKVSVDLSQKLKNVPRMVCTVSVSEYSEYFQDQDVSSVKSENLDFILRFGFNIIRGEILNAAKFGIWSFHHDDEQKYRGGPPAFWEIYKRDPVSAAMMQRLTEKLDAGIVLKKAWFKTLFHSYRTNLDVLLLMSAHWPAYVANEIVKGFTAMPPPSETTAPIYKVPGNLKMAVFLVKLLFNRIGFYWNDLFRAEKWNIGVVNRSVQEIVFTDKELRTEEILWMKERTTRNYLADPAGFMEENKVHILMEDFSYAQNKAHISEAVFDPFTKSFSAPLKSIETKSHLSYPFIFVHGENIYCIPESYRYGYIGLYKRNYSEGTFVEDRILLPDVDAVDPTLINFQDKWWLFFTLKKFSNSHLFIYYADDLHSKFIPHPRNPVKMDIRSSRPAGMPFQSNGQLYRPAQDCSESYGKRVAINCVKTITETEFEEETLNFIGPLRVSRYTKGLHTLFGVGKYTLIDAKRYKFNFYHFSRQAKHKFRKH